MRRSGTASPRRKNIFLQTLALVIESSGYRWAAKDLKRDLSLAEPRAMSAILTKAAISGL
jgi:hypothetical protein